jgi:GT2 family glycosyltransferase
MNRGVTIVVPVFNALDETVACLSSLLQSDARECRIIVNDDGSPLHVAQRLRDVFAANPNVEIHSNFRNRGYTANIQYGVDAATTQFVAIVNSDTVFPASWLGKLVAQLQANPVAAAVGPLSNAASYQSIPELKNSLGEFSSNPGFGEGPEQLWDINCFLETLFRGRMVDAPILNGFCTLFRREAVLRAGGFNPAAFPTGYGEENDLCMRLLAMGLRLGVALDTFVYHGKSKSFGTDKKKEYSRLGREALERLYGVGFVPDFAAVLDRNAVLSGIRYVVTSSFRDAGPLHLLSLEPGDVMPAGPGGASIPVITLTGPAAATVWPDRVETRAAGDAPGMVLEIGSASLDVSVPEGSALNFCGNCPIESLLGVCAVQSHFEDLAVVTHPASHRSEAIVTALATLDFHYAYVREPAAGTRAA